MIGIQRLLRKLGNEGPGNDGFTLVELSIVLLFSVIILAGILVLLGGSTDLLKTNRNLLAITDSSRRALSTMARQLRGALKFERGPGKCGTYNLTFRADVKGDTPDADVTSSDNILKAPTVWWCRFGTYIFQITWNPDGTLYAIDTLASDVQALTFQYFRAGSATPLSSPETLDINGVAERIRITVTVQKGKSTRTLFQDVFLRVMNREPE